MPPGRFDRFGEPDTARALANLGPVETQVLGDYYLRVRRRDVAAATVVDDG